MKTGYLTRENPTTRILLADDDPDDCFFFREALQKIDFPTQLIIVHDVDELLYYLRKSSTIPDILFLDLNMPKKNGFCCLQEIRKNPNWQDLFIVMYSTYLDKSLIETLAESGANHFIQKPAKFGQLVKMIERTLEIADEEKADPAKTSTFIIRAE